jgi:hypothetical protein
VVGSLVRRNLEADGGRREADMPWIDEGAGIEWAKINTRPFSVEY